MMQDRGECPFVYPPQPWPWNTKSILQTAALHNSRVSASYQFMQKRHGPRNVFSFHTYHMGNEDSIATVLPPTGGLLALDPILVLMLPRSTSCSPVLRTPYSNFPWPLAKSMVCLAASARSPWPMMRPVLRSPYRASCNPNANPVLSARLHEQALLVPSPQLQVFSRL